MEPEPEIYCNGVLVPQAPPPEEGEPGDELPEPPALKMQIHHLVQTL